MYAFNFYYILRSLKIELLAYSYSSVLLVCFLFLFFMFSFICLAKADVNHPCISLLSVKL